MNAFAQTGIAIAFSKEDLNNIIMPTFKVEAINLEDLREKLIQTINDTIDAAIDDVESKACL